jgi:hypothetical protein
VLIVDSVPTINERIVIVRLLGVVRGCRRFGGKRGAISDGIPWLVLPNKVKSGNFRAKTLVSWRISATIRVRIGEAGIHEKLTYMLPLEWYYK